VQKKLFEELKVQRGKGVTVLLSSHNLAEVQEYCDRVAFIKDGAIVTVTDLNAVKPRKIVTVTDRSGARSAFPFEGDASELIEKLAGMEPADFTVENESIEEQFMSLYGREETI